MTDSEVDSEDPVQDLKRPSARPPPEEPTPAPADAPKREPLLTFHFSNGQFGVGGRLGRPVAIFIFVGALVGAVGAIGGVLGPFHPATPPRASCVSDAAQLQLAEAVKLGKMNPQQFTDLIICKVRAGPGGQDIKEPEIVRAVRQVYDTSRLPELVDLLKTSNQAQAAESLASDPTLQNLVSLKAVGTLLFAIDTKGAIKAYERAHALAPDDPEVLNRLGQLYARQERYPQAISLLTRLLQTQADDPAWQAIAHNNLGSAYQYLGNRKLARDNYQQAAAINARLGNRLSVARQDSNIAQLDLEDFVDTKDQGKLASAKAGTARSEQIFEALGATPDVAIDHGQLSIIDFYGGDLPGAQREGEKAVAMYLKLKDSEGVILARNVLGEIYLKRGDLKAAEAAFKASRIEAEKQGMREEVATAWMGLAKVAAARGDTSTACTLFDQGFAVWKTMDAPPDDRTDARKAAAAAGCRLRAD